MFSLGPKCPKSGFSDFHDSRWISIIYVGKCKWVTKNLFSWKCSKILYLGSYAWKSTTYELKICKNKKMCSQIFFDFWKKSRFFVNFEFSKCCKTLIYHNVVMPQPKKLYKDREWIKTGCPTRGFLKKTNFAIFLLILIFENFEKSIFLGILP